MDTLTSSDRCDGCSAAAYVRVGNAKDQILDFCAHHYNKHGEALSAQGFSIFIDNTDLLTRRAVGAEVK